MEQMPKRPLGLGRRGSVWRYRKAVPEELQEVIGKTEIVVSLETSDYKIALRKYHIKSIEAENRLAAARRELMLKQSSQSSITSLSTEELQSIVLSWFHDYEKDSANSYAGSENEIDSAQLEYADGLVVDIDALKTEIGPTAERERDHEYTWGEEITDALLEKHSLSLPKDSENYRRIKTLIVRGVIESKTRRLNQLKSSFGVSETDSYFESIDEFSPVPSQILKAAPKSKVVLSQLLEKYLAEKSVDKRTEKQYRSQFQRLIEFIGSDRSIREISRDEFVAYRDLLCKIPRNATQRFPGKTYSEIVDLKKAKNATKLSPRTINKSFDTISTLFKFAERWGLVERNLSRDLRMKSGKNSQKSDVRPYSIEELGIVFSAPIYTGCIDDEHSYRKVGDKVIRRHRFWVPLIALYSGMRLNEICQLYTEDIKFEQDLPYIEVRLELENGKIAADKRLKNGSARRRIPIHPELEKLGFLSYISRQRKSGHIRLFPALNYGNSGYSDPFQKWFARFLDSLGLKKEKRALCFHSFRHTFRDAMRNASVFEGHLNRICGWTESNNTGDLYGRGASIKTLHEEIRKVEYEGLDLSHLYLKGEGTEH